jgi:chorismate synthase
MGSTWGKNIRISLFGESHGAGVGIVLDGLPPGLKLDWAQIMREMARRAPGKAKYATPRAESDAVRVQSGLHEGKTTGAPLMAFIDNENVRSADYQTHLPRPSHADYTAFVKYQGFADMRGGGHFSGRLTAPIVFAGAVAKQLLRKEGVTIGAHILRVGGVCDTPFDACAVDEAQLKALHEQAFPVVDSQAEKDMKREIEDARSKGDSVGGMVECAAVGLTAGWGEPFFESVESVIAGLLFSIPGIKGVTFGAGMAFAGFYGSQANDALAIEYERVYTRTNHSGGIAGGITNGMPLVVQAVMKPTPSIRKEQHTVDLNTLRPAKLKIEGRHDPCIVVRALAVVEACVALGILELAMERKKRI